MSKKRVPPPAASARLPVAAPSQSVRPGSLKWRCTSIRPGRISNPLASISSAAPGSWGPIATIWPSSIATSAVSPLTTKSGMALLQQFEESHPDFQSRGNIFGQNCLIGMMANAAGARKKQHSRGHAASDDHGIVARAARHAMNRKPGVFDSALQHLGEIGIHGDGGLIQTLLPGSGETAGGRDLFGAAQQPRY